MNTLSTFIIVLSVIGLYINLYGNTDLRDPELMTNMSKKISDVFGTSDNSMKDIKDVDNLIKELELDPKLLDEAKNVPPEKINDIINMAKEENFLQEKPKIYNEIGQEISKINKEENIVNAGKNTKSGSSVRMNNWVKPSDSIKDIESGLTVNTTASYKDNFPYKTQEFKFNADDSKILDTQKKLIGRSFKETAMIGTLILPENPDTFDKNNTYMKRAADIYKTRIGFENKILPDVRHINIDKLKEKDNPKLTAIDEITDKIEVKTRPDLVGFTDVVEHIKTHERLYPVDKVYMDMKNIVRNYNLK